MIRYKSWPYILLSVVMLASAILSVPLERSLESGIHGTELPKETEKTESLKAESVSDGLLFILNSDGRSYTVSDIGTCTDTEVFIPNTYQGLPVTGIGDAAFSDCRDLKSIHIPQSVTDIGTLTFSGCVDLTQIELPNHLLSIPYGTFANCANLTDIKIPSAVKIIDECAFIGCSSLKSIKIPKGAISIGASAFQDCTALEYVDLSDSITSIGDRAFESCTNLTRIMIPSRVTSLGERSFFGCKIGRASCRERVLEYV